MDNANEMGLSPLITQYLVKNEVALVSLLIKVLEIDANKYSFDVLYNTDSSFRILFDLLKDKYPMSFLIEDRYVDRTYRDSYYLYYASKHKRYRRFCKRMSIFHEDLGQKLLINIDHKLLQDTFMGAIVLRPLTQGKIGRSLLSPKFFAPKDSFMRYTSYRIVVSGQQLEVNAFPYSMQDGETTTCAEITILNLMDYFSRKYQDYRFAFPSDISEIIDRHGYERTLPSKGLKFSEISRVFSEIGFFPRLYSEKSFEKITQLKRNMHYYVESGIPVAIGVKKTDTQALHAITCIGHVGKNTSAENIKSSRIRTVYTKDTMNPTLWVIDTADLIDEYIFMDDGNVPYSSYSWREAVLPTEGSPDPISGDQNELAFQPKTYLFDDYEPKTMMVPLYKRMFLEAEDAFDVFLETLANESVGIQDFIKQRYGSLKFGIRQNPLVLRVFLASSRHFRQKRIEDMEKNKNSASDIYSKVLFPKFVWVCEIYTPASYTSNNPKAMGEIVLDATSVKHDVNVIIYHYFDNIRASNLLDVEDGDTFIKSFDTQIRELEKMDSEEDTEYAQRVSEQTKNILEGKNNVIFYKLDKWRPLKPYDHNLFKPDKPS